MQVACQSFRWPYRLPTGKPGQKQSAVCLLRIWRCMWFCQRSMAAYLRVSLRSSRQAMRIGCWNLRVLPTSQKRAGLPLSLIKFQDGIICKRRHWISKSLRLFSLPILAGHGRWPMRWGWMRWLLQRLFYRI